jgi:hypothetical protein
MDPTLKALRDAALAEYAASDRAKEDAKDQRVRIGRTTYLVTSTNKIIPDAGPLRGAILAKLNRRDI